MDKPERLNSEESRQLAEHLAALAHSGLPLPGGLRTAAEEIPNQRLAAAMVQLASQLEAGRSLDAVLADNPRMMPAHMRRLIETGVRSGDLPTVLVRLVDLDRTSLDLRRGVWQAIAYPFLLFGLLLAVTIFILMYVAPGMGRVFEDFRTELPLPTQILMAISGSQIVPIAVAALAMIAGSVILMRIILPGAWWQAIIARIPLIGPTIQWRGAANWSRLLSLLLRENTPLPEAMQMAAEGVDSPLMRAHGARIARVVAAGVSLPDAVDGLGVMPASLSPMLHWGQEHGLLPEALDRAAEMFETRVQLRAALLRSILPPVTFIFIALAALMLMNSLMAPLVKLIGDLSGGSYRYRHGGNTRDTMHDVEVGLERFVFLMACFWATATLLILLRRMIVGRLPEPSDGRFLFIPYKSWRALGDVFRVIYWFGFFFMLLAVMGLFGGAIGILLWFATVVIVVMVNVRYGEMERRSILWALATAMEKGIPLPECARALAEESRGLLSLKTWDLANSLENGVPLAAALESAHIRLPSDALVAVRTGADTGGLAAMLKSSAHRAASLDAAIHGAIGRIAYLSAFVVLASALIAFMAIKIVPAYIKIFDDFHTELPTVTRILLGIFAFGAMNIPIVILGFLVIIALLIYAVGRYTDAIRWDPPGFRKFGLPLDGAVVLRSLAEAVGEQRSMHATLASLARQYPKPYIRQQLAFAETRIAQGINWCDSLQQSGLIPEAETGVLKAADRVGNLAWSLNDMADRLVRKFTARLTGVMAVGFPLVVLSFAGMVLLIAAGMIYPLAALILHLS